MDETSLLEKIKTTLLHIVEHKEKPEIIFVEIDTGGSDEGIVPFLNIHGSHILPDNDFQEAIKTAVEHDNYGYIVDVLDVVEWDEFELKLVPLYPNWPNERTNGDQKIVNTIKDTIQENPKSFTHVKVLYFHYVDNFDFVKIIDEG